MSFWEPIDILGWKINTMINTAMRHKSAITRNRTRRMLYDRMILMQCRKSYGYFYQDSFVSRASEKKNLNLEIRLDQNIGMLSSELCYWLELILHRLIWSCISKVYTIERSLPRFLNRINTLSDSDLPSAILILI